MGFEPADSHRGDDTIDGRMQAEPSDQTWDERRVMCIADDGQPVIRCKFCDVLEGMRRRRPSFSNPPAVSRPG